MYILPVVLTRWSWIEVVLFLVLTGDKDGLFHEGGVVVER